ncbi:MAG: L,D-transpeptidase family protein, partial [Bacteroidota bacterium]|nr:L,D-transpeptidase family protein [Bacteroidota bacterium]
KLYRARNGRQLWFNNGVEAQELRNLLMDRLDQAQYSGLIYRDYKRNIPKVRFMTISQLKDSSYCAEMDRSFTDAVLAYSLDLYNGGDTRDLILYDEISNQCAQRDKEFVLEGISRVNTALELERFLTTLEPTGEEYLSLKEELRDKWDSISNYRRRAISTALRMYRWTRHFQFPKWVEVNIPEARLRYYENNQLVLQMKVVVGKPKTRTPRFVAHCNHIILYPYWNVPKSIAIKEYLPKIKRNPHLIDEMNMQLIEETGRRVNHLKLDWSLYGRENFPFTLRQSTGCDNSLGVIKFDLTSPFSVYLHDTNFKQAFKSGDRFLSHGCIRLELPFELAEKFIPDCIDSGFLRSCLKGQLPVELNVQNPVPVFVLYRTVVVGDGEKIGYLRDIYGLQKSK